MKHEADFRRIIEDDPDIAALLAAIRTFPAPDLWLVSGMLFQTVWNILERRSRGHGILDVDLFYFDPDTSEDAEDRWIKRVAKHFASRTMRCSCVTKPAFTSGIRRSSASRTRNSTARATASISS